MDRNIKKNEIKRLAYKAGIMRISSLSLEELQAVSKNKLEELLKDIITYMKHKKRQTVTVEDCLKALPIKMVGVKSRKKGLKCKIKGSRSKRRSKPLKRKSRSRKQSPLSKIKFYQKQGLSCLTLSKENFRKIVRHISKEYFGPRGPGPAPQVRFSAESLNLLQSYIEGYIINLLERAKFISIHAKRFTIQPKDIHLARKSGHNNWSRA